MVSWLVRAFNVKMDLCSFKKHLQYCQCSRKRFLQRKIQVSYLALLEQIMPVNFLDEINVKLRSCINNWCFPIQVSAIYYIHICFPYSSLKNQKLSTIVLKLQHFVSIIMLLRPAGLAIITTNNRNNL